MSPLALFWLATTGLIVTCLAAIGAQSLTVFARHELAELCRRRNRSDRLGQILRRHEKASLAAESLQVVTTAVAIGAGGVWVWLIQYADGQAGWFPLVANAAGGALVLLAVEIWIPRAIARLWAEPLLFHSWPLWQTLSVLLAPLVLGARFVDTLFHRLVGRPQEVLDEDSFEEEIRTLVTEGHREGLLEEDAREMIEGVIELSDVDVSAIMTPRTDMVCIPISLSWQEVLEAIIHAGHTRIPVYQRTRDDIVGVLHAKDLLPELVHEPGQAPSKPWTALLREPYFVPETKPVDVLLQEFQRTRNHMAVVLDEYGGVAGLVTLEDALEEIVGEIADEYDKVLADGIKELDEHTAEALGRVHIDEINERLGVELPEDDDYDTIAGFVFSELGHVPAPGEEIVWQNVRVIVVEATRRRIERVRIEVLNGAQREPA
ncbi:MAG: hemolysin family protein [Thermoguttaceae bacterium]